MPEVGFDCRRKPRSTYGDGDISPDLFALPRKNSPILVAAKRCSFASDVEVSQVKTYYLNQHLAGYDVMRRHASSGPDSDLRMINIDNSGRLWRKAEVQRDDSRNDTRDSHQILNSVGNSFSQALKECQDNLLRSESCKLKEVWSFPMTRVTYSPRFGANKKEFTMTGQNSNFPSPETPNFRHSNVDTQKGWSSERVPFHRKGNRSVATALLPLNNNGRTLPSKWEDAERWIFSPISGDGSMKTSSQQSIRKPKAKSGPLGPPGTAYRSLFSPATPMFEGGRAGNLMGASPFSSGVTSTVGLLARSTKDNRSINSPDCMEPFMARSISIHGCSEVPNHFLASGILDKNLTRDKEEEIHVYHAPLRKDDISTHMSPGQNNQASPNWEFILPTVPSAAPIHEFDIVPLTRSKVRDVLVDDHTTMARRSSKQRKPFPEIRSGNMNRWNKKDVETPSYSCDVSEAASHISIMKREEAKITAWENLQKAKAEAEIRKLEMKLEKKRSSSMGKIINKLKSAQKKAQSMRSNLSTNHQVTNTSNMNISLPRGRHISSFSGCFTCHAQ